MNPAQVIENLPLNDKHFILTFKAPLSSQATQIEPRPGQFYMIGVKSSLDPLLKRPFSFFGKSPEGISVLYRVVGKGTAMMSRLRPGDEIEVLGPLGNSYPLPPNGMGAPKDATPLIIAGGVGIASVMPLIRLLGKKAVVFYGGKNMDELLMLDEIASIAGSLHTTTDDGSYGAKGLVTEALTGYLDDYNPPLSPLKLRGDTGGFIIYACGPRGMLKAVSDIAIEKGIKGYLSLEERMACGVGACLGCAVKTKTGASTPANKGYVRVCKEGPVFEIGEIAWE